MSRKPQTLEALCEKILPQFKGVDRETILRDAKDFYDTLVEDGFLVKGETEAELNARDIGFSYKSFDPKTIKKDFYGKIKNKKKQKKDLTFFVIFIYLWIMPL